MDYFSQNYEDFFFKLKFLLVSNTFWGRDTCKKLSHEEKVVSIKLNIEVFKIQHFFWPTYDRELTKASVCLKEHTFVCVLICVLFSINVFKSLFFCQINIWFGWGCRQNKRTVKSNLAKEHTFRKSTQISKHLVMICPQNGHFRHKTDLIGPLGPSVQT